ncbi:alpha/beta hydrolase [Candidatus Micrarchaeota archaeon]|nr:alpha/beta hydrolase [Candidatus Micrarchaeota archaeon]
MAERILPSEPIQVRPGYFLNVHESGNPHGRPVVFIHGRASSLDTWEKQLPAFAKDGRFRVIAYDINGHGFSNYVSHDKLEDHADDLCDLLRSLKITGPVDLVGHSDGTAIVQQFVLDHPEQVRKMVLISGYDRPPVFVRTLNKIALGAYWLARPVAVAKNRVHLMVLDALDKRPALGEPLHPPLEQLMEHFRTFNGFDIRKVVPIRVPPTLLIHATDDPRLSSHVKKRLKAKWDAVVAVAGRIRHSPHYFHPDRVNPVLFSFLADSSAPAEPPVK